MRSASAFRREAPRCPPGERREPLGACGPPASAPDPALVPFRGWAGGRRRLLFAKPFSLPLFPLCHYCGGGRALSSMLL